VPNQFAQGTDAGYAFLGPAIPKRIKALQTGITLGAYQRSGVVVADGNHPSEDLSPWRHATFLIQETVVTDAEGRLVLEAALCETTDPDGDLTWCTLWRKAEGPATLQLIAGTGKWEGISGQGEMLGFVANRADDYVMPKWTIHWEVDREKGQTPDVPIEEGRYAYHDVGFSIHGPHTVETTRELANGFTLEVNTQSGVLLSENREASSPRNFATSFDRGTTVMKSGKRVSDVMLLEDTDPDGDVVWLCHLWWYGTGPGRYRFIGGIGKWEGITGEGKTLGVLRYRKDDHWMLRSEMHWNINREE